ncbi:MAG: type IV secretion system protein [Parvularculaceae bacterium]
MTPSCPSHGDLANLAALMASVDCQSAAYVAAAYEGLFGTGGGLAQALAGALTIYVAFYGYRLIIGAGSATAPDLVRRLALIGAVLALSSNWPAYQTLFVDSVAGGAEEIAGMMSSATTGRAASSASIAAEIDIAIDEMTRLASEWSRKTAATGAADAPQSPAAIDRPVGPAGVSAVNMLWLSAILLGVGSAGVIVITKISLAFLLALGPLFLMLALFRATRGLFEGWLKTIVAGAFVLIFTILATGGALSVVGPVIATIASDQAAGVNDAGPVFTLLIACIIFAMLVRQALTVTARLTAGWRLPFLPEPEAAAQTGVSPADRRSEAVFANERITGLVASLTQGGSAQPPSRTIATTAGDSAGAEKEAESAAWRRASRAYRGFGSSSVRAAGGYR